MSNEEFDPTDPRWFLAHSLQERISASSPPAETDVATGKARIDLWRQERLSFLRDEGNFADYAARKGTDADGLAAVLGESPVSVRERLPHVPDFVEYVRRALDYSGGHDGGERFGMRFCSVFTPFIDQAVDDVRKRILALDAGDSGLDTERLAACLTDPPLAGVDMLVGRALVLEVNIARVEGRLKRDSPHERFHEFMEALSTREGLLPFLLDYPVLTKDLVLLLDNWTRARVEIAERLIADLPRLRERLGAPDDLGQVREISSGEGDSHGGGRSVARVTFENGQHVMYKPRSLGTDVHFQDVLRWFNERGLEPSLRTLWVEDRGEYGWSEYAPSEACEDRAALERFYTRLGSYLAILHVLVASDMHFENMIASGEHPVMVDLEALFHVTIRDASVSTLNATLGASDLMHSSVLGVGLLPQPSIQVDDGEVVWSDFGGVSDTSAQMTSKKVAGWDRWGTDEIRIERRRIAQSPAQNVPTVETEKANAFESRDSILAGYRSAYRTLQDHRDAFLSEGGPLRAFADDDIRLILRPTQLYYTLLTESRHPDYQQDAADQDNFLDALWAGHPDLDQREAVIASEVAQMGQGDIPIFHTTPGQRDVFAQGGRIARDMLESSGLDRATARIENMSEAHMEQQSWFIDAALAAQVMGDASHSSSHRLDSVPFPHRPADGGELLEQAARIGDRLVESAIQQDGRITWLGLNLVREEVWQVNPAQTDLFNGLSGIGLFLGYLGAATGEDRFRSAAERTAEMITSEIESLSDKGDMADYYAAVSGIGAFGVLGGSVYALSHLGHLWKEGALLDHAASVVPYMAERVAEDTALDVISGSAGGLFSLLSLHAAAPDPAVLDVAERMAARLSETAVPSQSGQSWVSSISARPLAGFSHGASGIATALARLDRARGTSEHRDLVHAAFDFERALFDEDTGNWPDLRDDTPRNSAMVAWCHGATGVGLARADVLDGGGSSDPNVRQDLEKALRRVRRTALGGESKHRGVGNHSICHGDLGNLELLQLAATTEEEREGVRLLAADVLAQREGLGWQCGVPLGIETPGLMPGLSGIGYTLLKLADPASVPSVLLLGAPLRDASGK
ncbi:type 2 lanthipeptide synthetase LanM family protein [Nocardiopsis sp. MG754419]|uniref:type 2 lanthipeptide synthetase LanM family protein n=1 Tax=Nocardiopsis sp. MG754419 TaxID=2259865 RepID=UPI001BA71A20|nr:type 2 lanthipeptide synthetase LanM family protein [Nocardiopsis sp. MG754419]MBR8741848.1 hypothetical protein [Nocardiopsis sp. MG754419]